ncbi:IS110 family transposase, partial [Clostridium senegalense]|nr:IS110 family transposase [Clostridium senegalense]NEU05711.1 IS110 family transposase [Clostridium senegalense]
MNDSIIKVNLSKVFIGIDLAKETHVAKAININGELISTLSKLDNSIEGFQMFDDWVQNI